MTRFAGVVYTGISFYSSYNPNFVITLFKEKKSVKVNWSFTCNADFVRLFIC